MSTLLINHLVHRRGALGVVASAWGFMAGIIALLTVTAIIFSMLGGGYYIVLIACLVMAGLDLFLMLPLIRNEFYSPKARTWTQIVKLLLLAIIYGFVGPFSVAFTAARLYGWKLSLIWKVHKHNMTLEKIRLQLRDMAEKNDEQKQLVQGASQKLSRSDPRLTLIRMRIEKSRLEIKDLEKRRTDLLFECRQIAYKLGTKLYEYDKSIKVQSNVSVAVLTYNQLEKTYITTNTLFLRRAA